jgi:hypothetical protein
MPANARASTESGTRPRAAARMSRPAACGEQLLSFRLVEGPLRIVLLRCDPRESRPGQARDGVAYRRLELIRSQRDGNGLQLALPSDLPARGCELCVLA